MKGHYFGNKLDATHFPVEMSVRECVCACACIKAESSVPKLQGFAFCF